MTTPDLLEEPGKWRDIGWKGVAVAETSVVESSDDLYELAGLGDDRDRWSILAIDAHAMSHGNPRWSVRVYALDRTRLDEASFDGVKRLEAERGAVPVTEIELHDVDLDAVVRCMKDLTIQLRNPNFPRLEVVERSDHPPQI